MAEVEVDYGWADDEVLCYPVYDRYTCVDLIHCHADYGPL
jgi:hypothetical protein